MQAQLQLTQPVLPLSPNRNTECIRPQQNEQSARHLRPVKLPSIALLRLAYKSIAFASYKQANKPSAFECACLHAWPCVYLNSEKWAEGLHPKGYGPWAASCRNRPARRLPRPEPDDSPVSYGRERDPRGFWRPHDLSRRLRRFSYLSFFLLLQFVPFTFK